MADDFDWAERRRFLTSFFFFCLVARAFTLRRSASLPEQVSTSPAELSSSFFPSPSCGRYPREPTGGTGTVECLLCWRRRRETQHWKGGRISRLDPQSVGRSSPVGWDATTQPCQVQRRAEQPGGTRGAQDRPPSHRSVGLLVSQLDSVCRAYPATTRLR